MDIVKTHYGAYGIGVEYVYTMVHKAPPTVFPSTWSRRPRTPLDGRQARIAHERSTSCHSAQVSWSASSTACSTSGLPAPPVSH